jgi:TonB family protein
MTLWMLYAILFGCLAAAAGLALERGARSLKVPTRFVWLAVLLVAIALPFGLPMISANTALRTTVEFTERPVASAGPVIPVITAPSWVDRVLDGARNFDQPLILFWIGLSALCLGRFTMAIIKLRRQRSQWVAREIVGTECFVTEDIGPAVVAIPDTRIVVPQWVLALDHDSLATVIRHERQHKLARDGWLIVTGSVATALLPWNPAMWLIQRRLRLAVEMDCDARVLAEETRVERYGSLLIAIAHRPQLMAGLGATLSESTSDLERRIAAMTARPPKHPRTRALLFAAAGVAAIAIACSMPAPDMVGPRAVNPSAVPVTAPGAFFEFQVEKPASANPSNMPPRYPDQLRAAGIQGSVVAKFVVDTAGHAEMRTFEVLKSEHEGFTAAVREALPKMRFVPAQVTGGRKVRQLIQMPFTFSLVENGTSSSPQAAAGQPLAPRKPQVLYETPAEDTMPRLIEGGPPIYPAQLRAANIEGMVQAKFVVRADGTVDMGSFIVMRSDHELFTTSVRAAVEKMRFRPATKDGRAAAKMMMMPFMFSLAR